MYVFKENNETQSGPQPDNRKNKYYGYV